LAEGQRAGGRSCGRCEANPEIMVGACDFAFWAGCVNRIPILKRVDWMGRSAEESSPCETLIWFGRRTAFTTLARPGADDAAHASRSVAPGPVGLPHAGARPLTARGPEPTSLAHPQSHLRKRRLGGTSRRSTPTGGWPGSAPTEPSCAR